MAICLIRSKLFNRSTHNTQKNINTTNKDKLKKKCSVKSKEIPLFNNGLGREFENL